MVLYVSVVIPVGGAKPVNMYSRQVLTKDRRRTYKAIRKCLGTSDYRQGLIEVGEGRGREEEGREVQ